MNFAQKEIKRINRNRMIIHGIFAVYFLLMIFAVAGGSKSFPQFLLNSIPFFLITATFAFFFIQASRSYKSYMKSKTYKKLGLLGFGSAEIVNQTISEDIENNLVYSDKKLILTTNWIVICYVASMHVLPISDLLWIYKLINSVNGIRSYFVTFSFTNQKQLRVSMKNEAQADRLILFIKEKYPNVLTGYSRSLYNMFRYRFNEFLSITKPYTDSKIGS